MKNKWLACIFLLWRIWISVSLFRFHHDLLFQKNPGFSIFFPAKSNRVFLKAMHVSYIVKGIQECSIKQLKFYHLTIFMDLIGISVARKKCSSLKKAGIKSKNLNQSSIIIIIHCKNSMVWKYSNNWIFCPLYSIASFHTFSTFILFGRTKKYIHRQYPWQIRICQCQYMLIVFQL